MFYLRLFLWIFLTFAVSLTGKIIDIAHFSDIYCHLTDDSLVILDIDDTLLIPSQMLGCDEWFQYQMKKNKWEGMEADEALEYTLAQWEAVRHLTKMEIVESHTEEIISCLQKQGYPVMGLTTQGLALTTRTIQQLNVNGVNLSLTAPYSEDVYFCLPTTRGSLGVLYRRGILFTSGTPKGEAFFTLCDRTGLCPTRIIFVNDKATHLRDLEVKALERGVEFIGLRYAYSDARKARFSPEIADFQFSHSSFTHILSDKETLSLLK